LSLEAAEVVVVMLEVVVLVAIENQKLQQHQVVGALLL
tara:strand:- start:654 stop:767 length:114 start_codon:yes stop_codon:yes gene_type:complete